MLARGIGVTSCVIAAAMSGVRFMFVRVICGVPAATSTGWGYALVGGCLSRHFCLHNLRRSLGGAVPIKSSPSDRALRALPRGDVVTGNRHGVDALAQLDLKDDEPRMAECGLATS